jgi:hypothetical protein
MSAFLCTPFDCGACNGKLDFLSQFDEGINYGIEAKDFLFGIGVSCNAKPKKQLRRIMS